MYVFALIKSRKSPQNMLIYVYVELLVLYYYFFSTLKALVNQIFDVLCVLFSEFQCACNVSCKWLFLIILPHKTSIFGL